MGIASLATIPVVVAGWYFGIQGGIVTAIRAIAISGYFQSTADRPIQILLANPDNILRMISLLLVAVVTGRLSVFTRERREAVARLAHSNDLIYSILQITTHIEKALAPGEIQESLARELNELNLVHAIALYDKQQRVLHFNSTSLRQKLIDEMESELGHSLVDLAIPTEHLTHPLGSDRQFEPVVITNPEEEIKIILPPHNTAGNARGILARFQINPGTALFRLPLMMEEHLLGYLWLWGDLRVVHGDRDHASECRRPGVLST